MSISKLCCCVSMMLVLCALPALAQDDGLAFEDFQFTSNLGMGYSSGNYGTPDDTSVMLGLASVSAATGDFKFTASMPYISIGGRGLVIFDGSGNPIVVNRRTSVAPDVRTGWGDLNLSASYTVPSVLLDGFEVRLTGMTKLPTAGTHRRLSTGEADFGGSIDISKQFGLWNPFVTVGYLAPGQPAGFTLNTTTSVSAGTSLELSNNLVAIASYDYDSPDSPTSPAAHELFGSLSWVRPNGFTLTGYGTVGLSAGAPDVGGGFLISYAFN